MAAKNIYLFTFINEKKKKEEESYAQLQSKIGIQAQVLYSFIIYTR